MGSGTSWVDGSSLGAWALVQMDPERTGGSISGTLDLGGTSGDPVIRVAVSLRDGRFGDFQAPLIEGTAEYADSVLEGSFGLWRLGEQILGIDGQLPVDLALAAVPERRLDGQIMVRAVGDDVDMSFMEAVTPVVERAGGRFTADVGITGTWERPRVRGEITISDGAGTFPAIGVRHREIEGRATLSGDSIRVERLVINSGRGAIEVQGVVRLEGLTRPITDLRITAREFLIIDVPNFLTIVSSGDLQLQGPLIGSTLTGRGTATSGVLYFADLVTKRVINLEDPLYADVIDTSLIRRQGLGAEFPSRFLDSLTISGLELDMGREVWLRSGEANIQLTGSVVANKLGTQYRLDGTLSTPRGTYRLPIGPVTREFAVTRGEVRYFGTPDLSAGLDIDARHVVRTARSGDVTVFVNVGGTLYVPRLTLTSDIRPPISETEIISYLLVGAPSIAAAAAGQASLIQQGVAQLAGVLSGQLESSLISDIGIPLDYIEIRPGDIGAGFSGTEIALGKQVWDRWFITLSPRICPRRQLLENLGAGLEFRMSSQWKLSANVDRSCSPVGAGTDLNYQLGLDLLWEKRY